MSLIATLLPQPAHVQRLQAALRDRHELRECDGWAELFRACDREPVRVAVVDLFAEGEVNFEILRQIKQRLPRLTLVAYVTMGPDRGHALFDAGRVGVDGLVLAGEDDAPRSLLALIERAESSSLAGVVRRALDGVDPLVTDAVLLSVARAHERLSPAALARLLAMPRRVVTQRLAASGFPPPQRLLTWGRLILAAHMLEDGHRSADRVARGLDFPSGSAFRNTCQRYLQASPLQVRERGGASYVIRILLRRVNARIAAASQARRGESHRRPQLAV
jgi:AraC-like DNA-binding protein